jgi:hypothetical protein
LELEEPAGPSVPAVAAAEAVFVWFTAPLSPGLFTRTETFVLAGAFCVAAACAVACWSTAAPTVPETP